MSLGHAPQPTQSDLMREFICLCGWKFGVISIERVPKMDWTNTDGELEELPICAACATMPLGEAADVYSSPLFVAKPNGTPPGRVFPALTAQAKKGI